MGAALALALVVVAYNTLINLWAPFHRGAYVPCNVAFATLLTVAVSAHPEVTAADVLVAGTAASLAGAAGLVAVYALIVLTVARSPLGHRIADRRVTGMKGASLARYTLVRIPIGTALVEEVIFRGVLFVAFRDVAGFTSLSAAVASSIAFGLWHITPSRLGLRINHPEATRARALVVVVAAVAVTTGAGLALMWVRLAGEGLLAPIALHAGVNSSSARAAAVAGGRAEVGR